MDKSSTAILAVRNSKFGKGLFAVENILKNSPIIQIKGEEINFSDSLELGSKESFCLQIGIDQYILPEEPFIFINHSCDPNSGINRTLKLIALRSIAKGEEITWDYSTSMLERHWTMKCQCGSPICRQLISDFDLLPKNVQSHYIRREIVMQYIIHFLQLSPDPQTVFVEK